VRTRLESEFAGIVGDTHGRNIEDVEGPVVIAGAIAEPPAARIEPDARRNDHIRANSDEGMGDEHLMVLLKHFGVFRPATELERLSGPAHPGQRNAPAQCLKAGEHRPKVRLSRQGPPKRQYAGPEIGEPDLQIDRDGGIGLQAFVVAHGPAPLDQAASQPRSRLPGLKGSAVAGAWYPRLQADGSRKMKAMTLGALLHSILAGLAIVLAAMGDAGAAGRPPGSSPAREPDPDRAFIDARSAFLRNDAQAFEASARRVGSDHLLRSHVDAWQLRLPLRASRNRPAGVPPAIDEAAIQRFLASNAQAVAADLLRRDWLLELGRQQRWRDFDREYPAWILRDDARLHCYHWLSRLQQRKPADGARRAIDEVRDLEAGCADLLEAMFASGRITRTDVRARMLAGLEHNSRETVERTAGLLGLDPVALARAWDKPAASLADGASAELALVAFARLARTDPQAAAARLEQGPDTLPLSAVDRSFAWALTAASGMRKLEPDSHAWTLRAMDARVGDATLEWMARAALRARDWPNLGRLIERMSERGREEPAWAYWHARALLAQGATDSGRARLRGLADGLHFYGQLAAEELGETVRMPAPRKSPGFEDTHLERAADRPGIARALRFYALGLRFDGNREWNFALRGLEDRELLAIAHWACRRGILERCVNTAERTRRDHDYQLRFVTPFRETLGPVSARHGLDEAWVYSLIRQESRFSSDARSSAGAQGLMQIMPATGRWIAGRLGVRDFRPHQLNDLDTNLQFGAYYLRSVMDELDGSKLLALAAYNAGPGRPRRWRASLPDAVEGAIFAEIIPFAETRDYVKQVLSGTTIYAQVLNGESRSLKSMLGSVRPPAAPGKETP
jgi:soluble lytic murein transglycosylase